MMILKIRKKNDVAMTNSPYNDFEPITKREKLTKIGILIILIITILESLYGGYLLYQVYGKKFKSINVEIGTKSSLSVSDFVKNKKYIKKASMITNLANINFNKVGSYKVTLSYNDKKENVKLRLVDTTAPKVKFQNITKYIDYKIEANDFIASKSDLSDMTVEIEDAPQITDFNNYNVKITVKDIYGNKTTKICKLSISWIIDEFILERGKELTKEDLLLNSSIDGNLLDDSRLKEISNSEVGNYKIVTNKNSQEKVTTIKVVDTTSPTLVLKSVTIYDDEEIKDKDRFIESVSDASGEVTTNLKTEIDYSIIGDQQITIEASDKYGNKTEASTTLTICKDTTGPVFYGLSTININKGNNIDYYRGVSATDEKDGICNFTVDSSRVNSHAAGTYYATYTSYDTKGNVTSQKRKVVVAHDSEDSNALVYQIASSLGNDVDSIRAWISRNINYSDSWGDGDPLWTGLNNRHGNCYVRSICLNALLEAKGYQTKLIWTTDKTHYWSLVFMNGVWRHVDTLQLIGSPYIPIMTDSERLATLTYGRDWDHTAWPEAK